MGLPMSCFMASPMMASLSLMAQYSLRSCLLRHSTSLVRPEKKVSRTSLERAGIELAGVSLKAGMAARGATGMVSTRSSVVMVC